MTHNVSTICVCSALQSATIYPPVVSSGKPLMPSEVSTMFILLWEV